MAGEPWKVSEDGGRIDLQRCALLQLRGSKRAIVLPATVEGQTSAIAAYTRMSSMWDSAPIYGYGNPLRYRGREID